MFVRFLFLIAIILAIDVYSLQAVETILAHIDPSGQQWVLGLFWTVPVIALMFVVALALGWTQRWSVAFVTFVRSFIMITYFSKLLVALVMLVDDIRRLLFFIITTLGIAQLPTDRSVIAAWIGAALGGLILASLTYGMIRNPYRYKVKKIRTAFRQLHEDLHALRIVQISDIHSGSFYSKSKVARSVRMINELKPDIVCFTGDLVNTRANEIDPYIDIFSGIRARLGIFSIVGNHDYGDYYQWASPDLKRANFEGLIDRHKQMGWQLLLNEHRVLEVGRARLGVIGVENYSASPRFQKYGDMTKATDQLGETDFQLLLSHDPSHWDDEVHAKYTKVNLTLSGHTHGFQFGLEFGRYFKWSPVQYVYKKWAGLYQQGEQYLYVNRGLGFLGYPGRVGILPEITLLTLEPSG